MSGKDALCRRLRLKRIWKQGAGLWPQLPLGLFLVGAGALNILAGFHAGLSTDLMRGGVEVTALSSEGALAALGSGAQIILGAALLCSGVALFWKLRVAWVFALLLLGITIALNAGRNHFGASLIVPGMAFILLAVLGRRFSRHTVVGGTLMSFTGVLAVLAYGTFGLFLLGSQFEPPITTLLTAFYYTIETLSTIGYGDYHANTPLAQGYMITLIVVGLSVFATAVFSVLGPVLSRRFDRLLNPREVRIVKKDHVIVVGSGTIARITSEELARRGASFVRVVKPGTESGPDTQACIVGEASATSVLEQAGIADARMLLAIAENDDENAFVVLAAKDIKPGLRVLAVANDAESARRLKLAHADLVLAPAEFGGRLLAGLAEGEALPDAYCDLLK